MKRFLVFTFVLFVLFFGVSCKESSQKREDEDDDKTSYEQEESTEKNDAFSETDNLEFEENVSSETGSEEKDSNSDSMNKNPQKKRFISELKAQYSAHEKNGYSLWKESTGGSEIRHCVDCQGYIVFSYSVEEDVITNVYNNAFITKELIRENNTGTSVYRIRQASTGRVLFSAEQKNGDQIIDLKYSSKDIFEDGFSIVVNMVESYSGITYKMGIIKSNGTWAVPLSENHPILTTMKDEANLSAFKSMYYLGEGILHFKAEDSFYFYNIHQNSVVKVNSELTQSDTRSVLNCADSFQNGVSISGFGFGGGTCKITSDGNIVILPSNFNDKLHERVGSRYYDRKNDRVIVIGITFHQEGFSVFDSTGNVIKKIENVSLVSANGFNSEGLAQVVLENKEGTKYYTVIDITGEFLFEPIEFKGEYIVDSVSKLRIDSDDSPSTSGRVAVVDRNGKYLYLQETAGDFGYENGIVYDEKRTGEEYIRITK